MVRRYHSREPRVTRICKQCGDSFTRHAADARRRPLHFCSRSCSTHWKRTQALRIFWSRIEQTPGCWWWHGPRTTKGYGNSPLIVQGQRFTVAHRLTWFLTYGDIPAGMDLCHTCDNRLCCNPAHLFLGTQADNMADMWRKERGAKGERISNAKLTVQDIYAIRAMEGRMSQHEIAAQFGIRNTQVSRIHRRETWSWLPEVDEQGQTLLPW